MHIFLWTDTVKPSSKRIEAIYTHHCYYINEPAFFSFTFANTCTPKLFLQSGIHNCKDIKPVNPKGNQSWIFIGRTDAEAETLILWPPDVKSWFIRKDPDAGKDWRQGEKGTTKDEMVGWHHWLNGHEFEQAPGDGEGQGSLACCSPWGHKESVGHNWVTEKQQHPQLYIKFLLEQFFFLFRITLISTKDKLRLIYLQNKFSFIKLGLIIYISPARIAIDQISSFESALLEFSIWNFQIELFKCLSRPGNQAKNLPSGLPARYYTLFPWGFMAP